VPCEVIPFTLSRSTRGAGRTSVISLFFTPFNVVQDMLSLELGWLLADQQDQAAAILDHDGVAIDFHEAVHLRLEVLCLDGADFTAFFAATYKFDCPIRHLASRNAIGVLK